MKGFLISIAALLLLAGCGNVTPRKVLHSANYTHSVASSGAKLELDNCLRRKRVAQESIVPCIKKAQSRDEELDEKGLQIDAAIVAVEAGESVDLGWAQALRTSLEGIAAAIEAGLTPEQREALK